MLQLIKITEYLIKSDGGNRPYEVQQPVEIHGAKSYRCNLKDENQVLTLPSVEGFLLPFTDKKTQFLHLSRTTNVDTFT